MISFYSDINLLNNVQNYFTFNKFYRLCLLENTSWQLAQLYTKMNSKSKLEFDRYRSITTRTPSTIKKKITKHANTLKFLHEYMEKHISET